MGKNCIKGHPMVFTEGEWGCLVCDMEKDLLGIQFPEYKISLNQGGKWSRRSLRAAQQIRRAQFQS